MKKYDVVALGEILIDMTYAGKSEAGQTLFEQNPGGAPANVLACVKRLGGESGFIGKIGKDMHGKFLKETLSKEKISVDGLVEDSEVFTTLAFVDIDENGDRSFSFARKPGADTCLKKEEVKLDMIKDAKIFHIGSLSLTDEPARTATLYSLIEAKMSGAIISYDPNYRAPLWESEEIAKAEMRSVLRYVDIIKISDEEAELVTGFSDIYKASEYLIEKGIKLVIVTMGKNGAHIRTKEGFFDSPALKVKAVDTTGAGDAFMGAFLYKLTRDINIFNTLELEVLKEFAEFANKVSGYCVQRRGAINAMPYDIKY